MQHFRFIGMVVAAAFLGMVLATNSGFAGADNADDGLRPPPASSGDQGKKRRSENELRDGYLQARALILGGQYKAGIAALRALDYDDSPDVANYLGYASRKLGNYDAA